MNRKTKTVLMLFIVFAAISILPTCLASSYDENPVTVHFEVNNSGSAGVQIFESRIAAPYGNTAYSNSTRIYYPNGTPVEAFWQPYTSNDLKMVFLIKANLSAGVNNFILTTGSPNLTSVQDIENVTTQYVIDSTENISGWTFNEPQNWYFGNILISPNITDPLYEYHLVHSNGGWSLNGSTRYNYTIADLAPGGTSQIGSGTGPTSTTGPTISAAMLYSPNGSEYFGKTNSQFGYPHSPIIVSELEPFSGSFSNLVTNDFNESIIRHSVYVSNISEMTKTMETQITYDRSSDLKSFVFINMFDNSQIVSTSKPFIDTFSGEITSTNGVSNRVGTSSYDGIFNKGYINDNANYSMFYYKPPNTPVSNFSTDPELANFSATGDILKHRTLSTYTDQPSIYYNYSVRVSDSNSSSLNHITGGDTH